MSFQWTVGTAAANAPASEDRYVVYEDMRLQPNRNDADEEGEIADVFAVLDGHGGPQCAAFATENIKTALCANFERRADDVDDDAVMTRCLTAALPWLDNHFLTQEEERTKFSNSGACVVLAVHWRNAWYVTHIGDCRAVAVYNNNTPEEPSVEVLTDDHVPTRPDERDLVRARCGSAEMGILPSRDGRREMVAGVLAVTRALGNGFLKRPQLSIGVYRCVPETQEKRR